MPRKKSKWVPAGEICVDTGQIMLIDPAYVLYDSEAISMLGKSVDEWIEKGGGPFYAVKVGKDTWHRKNTGLISMAGFGDGVYPVLAKVTDYGELGKRVDELRVRFDKNLVYGMSPFKIAQLMMKRSAEERLVSEPLEESLWNLRQEFLTKESEELVRDMRERNPELRKTPKKALLKYVEEMRHAPDDEILTLLRDEREKTSRRIRKQHR